MIDVWRSRPLDVHRWSSHPAINAVVDHVFDALTDEQRQAIRGNSNNAGRASGRDHLKVLLLDLYVAWKTDPDLCIGVARANGAYAVNSRYNALHISSRLPRIVDVLEEAIFLETARGSYNRGGSTGRNRTSRIKATSGLEAIFSHADVEPYLIDLHHKQECIILTADEQNEDSQSVRTRIEYKDTPQTIQLRDRLEHYNEFLSETYIDIPSLTDPWIIREKDNGDIQHIPVGQTNKFVRRIFSRGSWSLNGRFYGGWWQQVSKDLRSQIAINNEPTVEVDYKGIHVSILSALKDVPPRRDDQYALKTHIIPQFTATEQRNIVKSLVLTAINAKDEKSAYKAFRNDQAKGSPQKRLKDPELSLFLEAFLDENPHLSGDLCSDQGICLMFIDSQITDKIITSFINHERPVLSVHDSYIVGTFDVDHLTKAMSEASKELLGHDLSFDQTVPGYNDVLRLGKSDRDRYLSSYKDILSLKDRTSQYEDRIRRFMDHRKTHFSHTYWLG